MKLKVYLNNDGSISTATVGAINAPCVCDNYRGELPETDAKYWRWDAESATVTIDARALMVDHLDSLKWAVEDYTKRIADTLGFDDQYKGLALSASPDVEVAQRSTAFLAWHAQVWDVMKQLLANFTPVPGQHLPTADEVISALPPPPKFGGTDKT